MSDAAELENMWREMLTWIVQWGIPALMIVPYTPDELDTPEAWETCTAVNCYERAHFSIGMLTTEGLLGGVVCREHLVSISSEMKFVADDDGREFPG